MENKYDTIIKKLFKNNLDYFIFIYTPPKVGSTSLVTSLRVSLGKLYNIIHIHDEMMLYVLTGIKDVSVNEIINYLAELGKRVIVIDVYRTPIERKMSAYFEKLSSYHFNTSEDILNTFPIEKIINRFNNIFPYIETEDYYFEKYDLQIKKMFDFDNKYIIQKERNIYFIKLRLCDSHMWGNILSSILNINIVIISDYETDNKIIGELYKKFKETYKIPKNYLDIISQDKHLNYYYNSNEKEKYIEKWNEKKEEDKISYTNTEYELYKKISQENIIQEDIQKNHYIDNGCYCKKCQIKRRETYMKAKKGEKITEKIKHK